MPTDTEGKPVRPVLQALLRWLWHSDRQAGPRCKGQVKRSSASNPRGGGWGAEQEAGTSGPPAPLPLDAASCLGPASRAASVVPGEGAACLPFSLCPRQGSWGESGGCDRRPKLLQRVTSSCLPEGLGKSQFAKQINQNRVSFSKEDWPWSCFK